MGVSKKSAAGEDGRDPLKIRIKLEVPEIRAKKIRKSQCGWFFSGNWNSTKAPLLHDANVTTEGRRFSFPMVFLGFLKVFLRLS